MSFFVGFACPFVGRNNEISQNPAAIMVQRSNTSPWGPIHEGIRIFMKFVLKLYMMIVDKTIRCPMISLGLPVVSILFYFP